MTDKDSSPHIAALQELEAALDAHRRTQTAAAAARPASPRARRVPWKLPRLRLRVPALRLPALRLPALRLPVDRLPAYRLPFDPWSLIDFRHPLLRKTAMVGGGVLLVLLIGAGALWWRLSSG